MEAVAKGAREAGGLTIGILPGTLRASANAFIDVAIVTGIGYARNVIVVRSADAVIAIGGFYGTLTEIGFALDAKIPVAALASWEFTIPGKPAPPVYRAKDPEDAVRFVLSRI